MSIFSKIKNAFRTQMFRAAFTYLNFVGMNEQVYKPEYLLGLDFQSLQNKALEVLWKSGHARSALRQINVLAMNCGLRLQSMPNKDVLGISSEKANNIANKLESIFSVVRAQRACSYEGTRTFNEQEILAFWSWLIFNESFAVMRYSRNIEDVVPVTIQIINPLLVQSPSASFVQDPDAEIIDGIELKNSVPVAFWVKTKNIGANSGFERISLKGASGKVHGIHTFKAEIPGQIRGNSRLAPLFHEFQRIIESMKYEMDSMALNSRIALVVERSETVNNPDKFRQIAQSGGDLSAIFSPPDAVDISKRSADTGGIVVQSGEKGETFKTLDTSRPNVNINEFIFGLMKAIGPSIGIPYELWLALFGKAYSASKGSIDLAYKSFDQEIYEFSTGFEQPYYEAIVSAYVGNGVITLPQWNVPLFRAAYLMTKWYGTPKPSLNPYQEEKAASERVNNWRSSNEREAQLSTGTSFDVIADRRESELKRISDIETMLAESGISEEDLAA